MNQRARSLRGTRPNGWRSQRKIGRLLERLEARNLLAGDFDSPARWFESFADFPSDIAEQSSKFIGPVQPTDSEAQAQQQSEWVVRLTEEAIERLDSIRNADAVLDTHNADFAVLRGLGAPGFLLVEATAGSKLVASQSLDANRWVQGFSKNETVNGALLPDDQDFPSMFGLNNTGQFGATTDADIDAVEAWDISTGSPSVVVGVIDSGVDATHPDLYLNVWINQGEIREVIAGELNDIDNDGRFTFYDLNDASNAAHVRDLNLNGYIDANDLLNDPLWADGLDTDQNGFTDDFFGWNFRSDVDEPFAPNDPSDVLGHGTHVAGTIGAIGNNGVGVSGVNWQTSIMSLKFLDETNSGEIADAIAAINYATMMRQDFDVNIAVTNNSWGQSGSFSPALRDAIAASGEADILFVAAAGNGNVLGQGVDNDQTPFYPANYELDNIISVAASNANDRLSPFTNFGAETVDIAAPGVGILSTLPGGRYGTANGTSMATPHVSGVAALLNSAKPDVSATEIRAAILQSADELPAFEDRIAGNRRLNAFGTLTASTFAPRAAIVASDSIVSAGGTTQTITIRYTDEEGVDLTSLGDGDLLVDRIGFAAGTLRAKLIPASIQGPNTDFTVDYELMAPDGTWTAKDNGEYPITLQFGEVSDTDGIAAAQQTLGRFSIAIDDPNVIFVNSTTDVADSNLADGEANAGNGEVTLRAAIQHAGVSTGDQTIVVPDGVYVLSLQGAEEDNGTTGDLDVAGSGSLTIVGGGSNQTIIDANQLDRVIDVQAGTTLELAKLTLRNGNADEGGGLRNRGGIIDVKLVTIDSNTSVERGGGIFASGQTTIRQSTVSNNLTINDLGSGGGGIYNDLSLDLDASTLFANVSAGGFIVGGGGGGLLNAAGATATITSSTLSGNFANNADGGGVFNEGVLSINNSTVHLNRADLGEGGGIHNQSTLAPIEISNTIAAGNSSATNVDIAGDFATLGFNLIGNKGDNASFDLGPIYDLAGTVTLPIDPLLSPLQDNGGPTLTHTPLPGSPAIGRGGNHLDDDVDQRGLPRPQDASEATLLPSNRQLTFPNVAIDGRSLFAFGDALLTTGEGTDGTGTELYRFDPATEQATLVTDINPNGGSFPRLFVEQNGSAFFLANDGVSEGLYRYTAGGQAQRVNDLNFMLTGSLQAFVGSITAVGNDLYIGVDVRDPFSITTPAKDRIYRYTPVTNSLTQIVEMNSVFSPTEFNDELYFVGVSTSQALFRFDVGTEQVVQVRTGNFQEIVAFGDLLAFTDTAGPVGWEVYGIDPTSPSELVVLSDVLPGAADSIPRKLTVLDNQLFFTALSPDGGRRLYSFDADELLDPVQVISDFEPASFVGFDGDLYFAQDSPRLQEDTTYFFSNVGELHRLDLDTGVIGVSRGVVFLTNSNSGINTDPFVVLGDSLYLSGRSRDNTQQPFFTPTLWRFDAEFGATDIGAVERTLGEIRGRKFADSDGDGVRQLSEPGLAGWTIYADLNDNDRLDVDEPSTTTREDDPSTPFQDELGTYALTGIAPGDYRIREISQAGFKATFPVFVDSTTTPSFQVVSNSTVALPGIDGGGSVLFDQAATSGDSVILLARAGSSGGIYRVNELDQLEPLVRFDPTDSGTAIPSGSGGFRDLSSLTVSGNRIGFIGSDNMGRSGFYQVDLSGNVERIIDRTTEIPDTSTPNTFARFESITFSGDLTTIVGGSADGAVNGAYVISDSGSISTLVNQDTPDPRGDGFMGSGIVFGPAVVDRNRFAVRVRGGDIFNDGLFIGSGQDRIDLVADPGSEIAGAEGTITQLFDGFALDDGNLVFRANLTSGQHGIYQGDRATRLTPVVSTIDQIPQGTGLFTNFADQIAVDQGNVVFVGSGSGQQGVYANFDGDLRKVVDLGDTLDGKTPTGFRITSEAIRGDQIVFHVDFANGSSAVHVAQYAAENLHQITVTPGAVLTDFDFGNTPLNGSIRGQKFNDIDGDGEKDSSEPGLEGWTIYLDANGNDVLDSGELATVTDANGRYAFENLQTLVTYVVAEVQQDGWSQTLPAVVDGGRWTIDLNAGEIRTEVDFGNRQGSGLGGAGGSGQINGRVYDDLNRDGVAHPAEPGLADVTVFLDANDDGIRQSSEPRTLTSADGTYSFTNLNSDIYSVQAILGNGTSQTSPLGTEFAVNEFSIRGGPVQFTNIQDTTLTDVDGDGRLDLILALFDADSLEIRLGDGQGGFSNDSIDVGLSPGGSGPIAIAAGDLNGQGSIDLVVVNQLNGTASVLLDFQGDGFDSITSISVGDSPSDVIVGPFDSVTGNDIIVVNSFDSSLTLLSNDGTGGFTATATIPTGGDQPTSVAAGHFDSDDRIDLAVTHLGNVPFGDDQGDVTIFTGQANGSFANPIVYPVGTSPIDVIVDDLDADGRNDLAITNFGSNTASVLLGNANGTFAAFDNQISVGQGPLQVETADIEGDGDRDLLVTNLLSQEVSILRNTLSRDEFGFEPAETIGVGQFSVAEHLGFAVGSLDGNDTPDLVIANSFSDTVQVRLNQLVDGAHRVVLAANESASGFDFGTKPIDVPPTIDAIPAPAPFVEDAGPQQLILTGIAPGRSGGPPLLITATSSNEQLIPTGNLSVQYLHPSDTARLRFTPAPDVSGNTLITITVTDAGIDGNIETENDNTTAAQSFVVTTLSVNDAPTFFLANGFVSANQDSGPQLIDGFVGGITQGATDEAVQTLSDFVVSTDSPGMFDVAPAVDQLGQLTFTPKSDATGVALVTVSLSDNGGTENGGNDTRTATFAIMITSGDAESIVLSGSGNTFFLSQPDSQLDGVQLIDIRGSGDNTLMLDAGRIRDAFSGGSISVFSDAGDSVVFDDGWTFTEATIVDGSLVRRFEQTGASLNLIGPDDFTNPISEFDVNASGDVSALDALVIINELASRQFSESNTNPEGSVRDPSAVDLRSFRFYDVTRDLRITALDALRVINQLARESNSPDSEHIVAPVETLPNQQTDPSRWPEDESMFGSFKTEKLVTFFAEDSNRKAVNPLEVGNAVAQQSETSSLSAPAVDAAMHDLGLIF